MNDDRVHLDDSCCADLVLGLLATEPRAEALAHAETCRPCALRLRSHVSASIAPVLLAGRPVLTLVQGRRSFWLWAASLGAAAVLALVMLRPGGAPHAPMPASGWLVTPGDEVLLREGEPTDPHLLAGFAAYARHDLARAEAELSLARPEESFEPARQLYLAHVRLLRGDAAGSLALLRSLRWELVPLTLQRQGVAILADALRATGNETSADSLTRALRETPEWVTIRP